MNKIYSLLDEKFIVALFVKEILLKYPEFLDIKQVKISAIKKHIWETTYHIVFKFEVIFATIDKKDKIVSIYCTAHSNEQRFGAYEGSLFLWQNSFSQRKLTIPKPLFYSTDFNAFFYEGVEGEPFYQYIREKNFKEIEAIVPKVAAWFAKLHQLPIQNAKNFNIENSLVETVTPGKIHFLDKVQAFYPRYYEACLQIYEIIESKEKNFLNNTKERWLIHGDAHPENIIHTGVDSIAVIDFADMCLADFARDLGTFLQQLDFMMFRKINNQTYIKKIQQLFLTTYFNITKKELNLELRSRIDNYYNWTALRTVIFFLSKENAEPDRAHGLLIKICQDLKLSAII
ncbi:MAG: aminoglycoside phosphotransferase family protein [Patescibacteria group bacterium]